MKRALTDYEREILERLLEPAFLGRDQLKLQVKNAKAIPTNDPDNYGSIYLEGPSQPKANVAGRVPVAATAKDEDGILIDILLHVIDGLVNELEILKADGTLIKLRFKAEDMVVTVNKTGSFESEI